MFAHSHSSMFVLGAAPVQAPGTAPAQALGAAPAPSAVWLSLFVLFSKVCSYWLDWQTIHGEQVRVVGICHGGRADDANVAHSIIVADKSEAYGTYVVYDEYCTDISLSRNLLITSSVRVLALLLLVVLLVSVLLLVLVMVLHLVLWVLPVFLVLGVYSFLLVFLFCFFPPPFR